MSDTVGQTPASAWLHPFASRPAPSLSERLLRGLEAHIAEEAHNEAACNELANRIDQPIARFLLALIAEDEQHHHAVMRSMVARLQEELELAQAPADSLIPPPSNQRPVDNASEISATLRTLIRDEHEGARHVRHLARQEPAAYGGLYPLLLETIARDSEKHATILQFILHQIERHTS